MADEIVAKLIQKSGLRRNLPQPLDPAELGFCIDTGQLFIGAGPTGSGLPLTLELFRDQTTPNIGNSYLNEHIVALAFPDRDPGVLPIYETLETLCDFLILVNLVDSGVGSYQYYTRAYLGYIDSQSPVPGVVSPPLPNLSTLNNLLTPDSVTTAYVGISVDGSNPNAFLGLQFSEDGITNDYRGVGDLVPGSGPSIISNEFTTEDTGAIATMMNDIYAANNAPLGIATVSQNIEIFTETTTATVEAANPLRRVDIPVDSSPEGVLIFNSAFDTADAYFVDYSMNNVAGDYSRTGTLQIVSNPNTAQMAQVTDEYLEVGGMSTMFFEARINLVGSSNVVQLVVRNNDVVDLTMTYSLNSWKTGVGLT